MRRRPNPWIAIPSLIAGTLAGGLGWLISDLTCRPDGCPGWSIASASFGFLIGTIGMATVLVLTYRSIAEWRHRDTP